MGTNTTWVDTKNNSYLYFSTQSRHNCKYYCKVLQAYILWQVTLLCIICLVLCWFFLVLVNRVRAKFCFLLEKIATDIVVILQNTFKNEAYVKYSSMRFPHLKEGEMMLLEDQLRYGWPCTIEVGWKSWKMSRCSLQILSLAYWHIHLFVNRILTNEF